ncbi:MAG: hypothetical protein LC674_06530 [Actinobacteria bacterium]|nr:hypothetical protein [Actinomycetota bacterium]
MRIIVTTGCILLLTVAFLGASPNDATFGIYLIAGNVDARVFARRSEQWRTLPLETKPIISDQDILVYDFSKHAMRLTPEALKRLPRPPVTGIPFVVVGNDERIYPGVFYTGASSIPCDLPVIVTARMREDNSVPSDVIFIERAYPASRAQGRDLRSDERVRTIFGSLKKLGSL